MYAILAVIFSVVIEFVISFPRGDFERFLKSYENFLGILPSIIAITIVVVGAYSVICSYLLTLTEKEINDDKLKLYIDGTYTLPLLLTVLLWMFVFLPKDDTVFHIVPEFGEMWKRFSLWGSFIVVLIPSAVFSIPFARSYVRECEKDMSRKKIREDGFLILSILFSKFSFLSELLYILFELFCALDRKKRKRHEDR